MHIISNGETQSLKFKFAGFKYPIDISREDDKLWLDFGYNPPLMNEFKKCFSGMKWGAKKEGDKWVGRKQWSILYTYHNRFQIDCFLGKDPYKIYDEAMDKIDKQVYPVDFIFPLKSHQKDLASLQIYTRRCIWAADMGLGKSLSAIECFEQARPQEVWWVAINSALYSVKLEYQKWGAKVPVRFMTYDNLKKILKDVEDNFIPPRFVIFDESQKIKTPTTQRTEAASYLVNRMTEYWDIAANIIEMTGTPSPKSPLDWYSQCEIAKPGFIKEGNIHLFRERLAITERKESAYGGIYPEHLAWRDNPDRCDVCGKTQAEHVGVLSHSHKPSINEVEKLYKRMRGLVIVKLKKDCLDLPDKIYDKIYCKVSRELAQTMKMILKRAETVIKGLVLCRELSDGFQYTEAEDGMQTCPLCHGHKTYLAPKYIGPEKTEAFLSGLGITLSTLSPDESLDDVVIDPVLHPQYFETVEGTCPNCNGKGEVKKFIKDTKSVICPKDKVVRDLLEEYEDVGRVVIYSGFQASVDRCVEICKANDWKVIQVDGRGWSNDLDSSFTPETLLKLYQDGKDVFPKVAFVGHPGSAGTGITLTASPVIIYFSNDFNAENRMQSEDRIHRMGMDTARGARIVDIINLSTDEYVLDNLKKKRKLQDMTLGQMQTAITQLEEVTHETIE